MPIRGLLNPKKHLISGMDMSKENKMEIKFTFLAPYNAYGFDFYCVFDSNGRLLHPDHVETYPKYLFAVDIYYLPEGVYYVVEIFRGIAPIDPVHRVFWKLTIDSNGKHFKAIEKEDVPPNILAKVMEVHTVSDCMDLYFKEKYGESFRNS